jgi:hypothetical protein
MGLSEKPVLQNGKNVDVYILDEFGDLNALIAGFMINYRDNPAFENFGGMLEHQVQEKFSFIFDESKREGFLTAIRKLKKTKSLVSKIIPICEMVNRDNQTYHLDTEDGRREYGQTKGRFEKFRNLLTPSLSAPPPAPPLPDNWKDSLKWKK